MVSEGEAKVKWVHDTTRAIAQLKKQISVLKEQTRQLRESNREAKKLTRNLEKSGISLSTFITAGAGLAGVYRAVALINTALAEFIQLKQKAAGELAYTDMDTTRRLQQIGKTPEGFQRLKAMSDEATRGGGAPFPVSGMSVFYGRSALFSDEATTEAASRLPFIATLEQGPKIIEGAGKMVRNFGANALGGTILSNASAFLVAAEQSHVDIGQVASQLGQASQPVAALKGSTPRELLSAFSILASQMTPQMAGTTLANLAKVSRELGKAGDPGFQGGGLTGAIETFSKRGEEYSIEALGVNRRAFRALMLTQNPRGSIESVEG